MAASTLTVPQVLRRSAEILQTNGRIIGTFWDTSQELAGTEIAACRVCVNTAIILAAGVNPQRVSDPAFGAASPEEAVALDAIRAVNRRLGLPGSGDPITTLYRWHDGYGDDVPTNDQVAAALCETADAVEQSTARATGREDR